MNSYVNMGVGALLGTVFVLMTVSITSEGIFHSAVPEKQGYAIVAEASSEGEAGADAAAAAETPIATLLASADAAAGEAVSRVHELSHATGAHELPELSASSTSDRIA